MDPMGYELINSWMTVMWGKQCHKASPCHHHFYRCYKPFPNGLFMAQDSAIKKQFNLWWFNIATWQFLLGKSTMSMATASSSRTVNVITRGYPFPLKDQSVSTVSQRLSISNGRDEKPGGPARSVVLHRKGGKSLTLRPRFVVLLGDDPMTEMTQKKLLR